MTHASRRTCIITAVQYDLRLIGWHHTLTSLAHASPHPVHSYSTRLDVVCGVGGWAMEARGASVCMSVCVEGVGRGVRSTAVVSRRQEPSDSDGAGHVPCTGACHGAIRIPEWQHVRRRRVPIRREHTNRASSSAPGLGSRRGLG